MGLSIFPQASTSSGSGTVNDYNSGTTANRPAKVGSVYFDTTLNALMIKTNTGWEFIVDTFDPPVALAAVDSGSFITITWTASTFPGSTTGYLVTSSSGLKSTVGVTTSTTITETASGTYTYYVQAINANGLSAPSNTVSGTFTAFTIAGGTATSDATYKYNMFTSSGTFTPNKSGVAYSGYVIAAGNFGGSSAFGGTSASNAGVAGGSGSGNRNGNNGTLISGWTPIANNYYGSGGGAGGTPFNGNTTGGSGGAGAGNGANVGGSPTAATTYGSGGGGGASDNTGNWGADGGRGGNVVTFSGTTVANVPITVTVGAQSGNGMPGVVIVRYLK